MLVALGHILTFNPSQKRIKILHALVLLRGKPEVVLHRHFILPTADELLFWITHKSKLVKVPYHPLRIRHGGTINQRTRLTIFREVLIDGARRDLVITKPNGFVAVTIRHEKALLLEEFQNVLVPVEMTKLIGDFAGV